MGKRYFLLGGIAFSKSTSLCRTLLDKELLCLLQDIISVSIRLKFGAFLENCK